MASDTHRAFEFFAKRSAAHATAGSSDASHRVITTHAAWIFLAGDTAYKIKQPVNLGFLDFTTLPKRHKACKREIALNQPNAPQIYRGLRALVETRDGSLELCDETEVGSRTVVEWAVEMTRFDANALLSDVVQRSAATPELLQTLAIQILHAHDTASVANDPALVDRLSGVVRDIARALARAPFLPPQQAEAFRNTATAAFERLSPKLHQRLSRGFVRRCHGDLHCENIVVLDGTPVPFDALEFDERLGTVDVLYDLGFLLMDLAVRDGAAPAITVLNAYLDAANEVAHLGDLACLRFFMALRAGVRAMVTIHKLEHASDAATEKDRDAAKTYAAFAIRVLADHRPTLFAIGGGSGTGKSTVARALAPLAGEPIGAVHLRSDVIRKQLAGVSPATRLPSSAYTREASDRVYRAMLARAELALTAGHPVIVDAVFGKRQEQAAVRQVADRTGATFHPTWLTLDPDIQQARVANRTGDASDATPAILDAQRATLDVPTDWHSCNADADAYELAHQIAERSRRTATD